MKAAWDAFLSSGAVKWIQGHVIIFSSCVFAFLLLIVSVIIFSVNGKDPNGAGSQEAISTSDASDAGVISEEELRKLEYEAYPQIHEVMTQYYDAIGTDNEEVIQKLLPSVTEIQLKIISIQSSYLEGYSDIKCYTQKGLAEGSYYVYVTYLAKFKDFDTKVPAIDGFYVVPQDNDMLIYRDCDMTEDVKADCAVAFQTEEVQALYNSIKADYNAVVDADVALAEFVNSFEETLRNELARLIAIEENNKTLVEASENPEPADEGSQSVTTDQVKATTTVNVRSSDSENADRLGKVGAGTVLTRLETKVNGWSKIQYEGKDAYIKTEFLEAIDGTQSTSAGFVTTNAGVNVREKADEDGKRIALVEKGTKLELIEKLSTGWTKIKYNGKEAYVKSEYVD